MWLMLQQDQADDYVIATGESHSVQELVELAFGHVGLDWKKYVKTDPKLLRPAEVDHLIGNSSRARTSLGWNPDVDFDGSSQDDGRRRSCQTWRRSQCPGRGQYSLNP